MPRVIKNLNLQEVYIINSIEIKILDAMQWLPIEKENPVMRTASAIARYLAGVIFLVFGLNGFLNFPFPRRGALRDSSWVPSMPRITCG